MALRKIFLNTTDFPLQILNVEVASLGSYEPPYSQWAKAADTELLKIQIENGSILVSNGIQSLNVSDALALLYQFQTDTGGLNNYSYNNVVEPVTIPIHQQMIVKKRIRVEDRLIIRGQLCLI